ncbi:hypothetical protein D0Z07_6333 [Hyphodiscus hymeniophilus]|uniref:Uncharacterized protein n=1 Tax=Hyphodiscus hymeniophilus TaxID=353542 RepID=A0A9P7AUU0_9HELO|nr:hypothetical protein D0Z07_6333 [Hyphodiscus hymeniophilus]
MPASALKAAGARTAGSEMKIEIELRKMLPLPFFPARKLYVRPDEIRLKHVLASPAPKAPELPAPLLRAARLQEEAEKAKALEYERTHIMSRPFREIGRYTSKAFFDLFQAVKRSWSREGFTGIYVKEYRYKLDVSGGWALDGGRALDRLVTIKLEA